MHKLHIKEQNILQMVWDSVVMALWEIGLQIAKGLRKKMHNKEHQLYFANGDSRKKKMLRQVFATNISHGSERLPNKQKWLFLNSTMAKCTFQNTNTFLVVCRGHACNFKEAVTEICPQSAHVSAQTRSQLHQEREGVCKRRMIISSCCRAKVVLASSSYSTMCPVQDLARWLTWPPSLIRKVFSSLLFSSQQHSLFSLNTAAHHVVSHTVLSFDWHTLLSLCQPSFHISHVLSLLLRQVNVSVPFCFWRKFQSVALSPSVWLYLYFATRNHVLSHYLWCDLWRMPEHAKNMQN